MKDEPHVIGEVIEGEVMAPIDETSDELIVEYGIK